MDKRQWHLFGAASGIVFVALVVVSAILPGSPPSANASTATLKTFAVDHRDDFLAGMFLLAIGAGFFLVWLTRLRAVLREAEGGQGEGSTLAFGAGVAAIVLALAGFAVQAGFVYKAAPQADAGLVRLVWDGSAMLFAALGIPSAVAIGAVSVVVMRTGVLPRWVAWYGWLAAALNVVGIGVVFSDSGFMSTTGTYGFIPFGAFMIWVVTTSVALMQTSEAEVRAPSARAMPQPA